MLWRLKYTSITAALLLNVTFASGCSSSLCISSKLLSPSIRQEALKLRGGNTDDSLALASEGAQEGARLGDGNALAIQQEALQLVQEAGLIASVAHSLTASECLRALQVSDAIGLSSEEARARYLHFGPNALTPPPKKPLWRLVLEQFEDRLVQILLGVATLSAALAALEKDYHAFAEPVIILSILFINAVVGVFQSRSAEGSLAALKKLQPATACVLRSGEWLGDLPAEEIVPGDIIYLRVGDKVPADARIISLKTLTLSADEGCLTGESVTVSKNADVVDASSTISSKTNMLFSGTMVTTGGCFAVVVRTGQNTELGQINRGVQEAGAEHVKTPLGQKLDDFGNQLTKIIGVICVVVWFVSIPKFGNAAFANRIQGAIYYAKIAVALGVAAIPEGLPAVITLCLSLGTRRMAKKNVIVRKLPSVETLGCTSVICTDKTGTLTTNMMTVKALVTLSLDEDMRDRNGDATPMIIEREVEGVSYDPFGAISGLPPPEKDSSAITRLKSLEDVAAISCLCNQAQLEYKDGVFGRSGEPTEAALLVLAEKLGAAGVLGVDAGISGQAVDPRLLVRRARDYLNRQYQRLAVLEFNRDRKSMSVLVRRAPQAGEAARNDNDNSGPSENILFVKGAAEMVVARCNRMKLEDGTVVPISASMREQLISKLVNIAQRPLRCLALAYREGEALDAGLATAATPEGAAAFLQGIDPGAFAQIESDLVLVGLCGIKDPARPEAAAAMDRCRQAGIRVMMMTGDSKETAIAIAKDVHIFGDAESAGAPDYSDSAFTGQEFFALPPERQLSLLRSGNKVFCRTEPKDKQRLIAMLSSLGEITAMTGDGVNDAPALQQADIGIAMGITGTEVAKSAADMVLADDNFATIVSAVEEGRNIYSNMQTFICFLISCNIGEIATMFFAAILGMPEPLTPLHLLWVNLVTDGPPATALGFNPPNPTAMTKMPRPKNESILSPLLLTRYLVTGFYVGCATIGAFIWWYMDKGISLSQLSNWSSCSEWGAAFTHSAEAPNWPETPCDIFTKGASRPQSMALSVLVTIEMLKALSAVSLDSSLFRVPPWKNAWLLLGVSVPFLLHLAVLYVPALAGTFGLSALSVREWRVVLKFALPVLLVEETLKFIGRHYAEIAHEAAKKARDFQPLRNLPAPLF